MKGLKNVCGANPSLSKSIPVNFTIEDVSSIQSRLFFGFNVESGAEIGLLKNRTNVLIL